MKSRRVIVVALLVLQLVACADPPGTPKPVPTDYVEQSRSVETFRKIAPKLEKEDGVYSTYLSRANNPRRIVVVVRDKKTRKAMQERYGREIDGLRLRYEIAEKGFEGKEDGIEAVPTESLPTTWWGKVMVLLREWKTQLWGAPTKPTAPPKDAPPARDEQRT